MFMTDATAFILSDLMFFTSHLHNVEYVTTFQCLHLSAVNPTVPCMSLPLISLCSLRTSGHVMCVWSFCSSDHRMCVDFTLSLSVMFKPNSKLHESCGFTAPPTWKLIGPKSPHSYLLNIKYPHIHCDIITLHSFLLSVRSAKNDEGICVLSLFYWVELLICLHLF